MGQRAMDEMKFVRRAENLEGKISILNERT